MTYPSYITLKVVAIIVGLLLATAHLPTALAPVRFGAVLKSLPRNYPLGVVLMALATLWFVTLTGLMDLGEISNVRIQLMMAWTAGGVLMIIFVPGFLAMRAWGCLLLLAASVVIDAAFLVETPARFVMTLLAYAWAVAGMIMVYSPHLGRDALEFTARSPQRLRLLSWLGVVFGVILIALGLLAYP